VFFIDFIDQGAASVVLLEDTMPQIFLRPEKMTKACAQMALPNRAPGLAPERGYQ